MKYHLSQHSPSLPRQRVVVVVLAVWILGLAAPCAHCLTMAASPQAAPVAPAAAPDMASETMPADCPMHAQHAAAKKAAAVKATATAAAPTIAAAAPKARPLITRAAATTGPRPAPASLPGCSDPSSCCLEPGVFEKESGGAKLLPPAPVAVLTLAALSPEEPLPVRLDLPQEIGSDRSHAPPAFNRPLRN